jgi:tight adherence protein C
VSSALLGAAIGAVGSGGALIAVRATPRMRMPRLVDRLAPYLIDAESSRRLTLARSTRFAPGDRPEAFLVLRRLFGPVLAEAIRGVDRLVGGSASVRRRLRGLGLSTTVEEFRLEQVVWGAVSSVLTGTAIAALTAARGHLDVLLALVGVIVGAASGVLGRDWWLRRQLQVREQSIIAEFPVIADLLALAVVAGEAPLGALTRVCALTRGELAKDLSGALAQARAGAPITRALTELSEQTTVDALTRFLQGFVTAIERGTPLADVLRAQAADVREYGKRELLEAGGRKEVAMLVPVVFIVMPVTVMFALYPGLLTVVSLTQ